MSFADFNDIYRICSTYNDGGHSIDMVKLGIDMTPRSSNADLRSANSYRWWEYAEKEIQKDNREIVLI
ncbi:hypothetical protein V7266_29335 [Neobacillus drentensis]|uniref:hypothetical protein n=1 Tax=Neobacillus drentensis TaxID=220684 RepID=UPI002FFDD556